MPQNTQQHHGTRDMHITGSLPQIPGNAWKSACHRTLLVAMNPDFATEHRPKNSDLSLPRNP